MDILNNEYSIWVTWISDFCGVWTSVIQQAMQSEQGTVTATQYIQQMGSLHNTTLYNCDTISYPTIPDIQSLLSNLPVDMTIFKNTLDFMNIQINTIQQQTSGVFSGNMPVEGFSLQDTVATNCGDNVGSQDISGQAVLITPQLITGVIQQLQVLNSYIPVLEADLERVKNGINNLNATKQSAQDGSIVGKIKMPS